MKELTPLDCVRFLACAIHKSPSNENVNEIAEKCSGLIVRKVREIINEIFEQGEAAGEADQKKMEGLGQKNLTGSASTL